MAVGKKGEAKKLKIIQSASYCLCHYGDKGATFQAIAKHCQVSQASVVKYLGSVDNIFPALRSTFHNRCSSPNQVGCPGNDIQVNIFFYSV